jgi:hypothetical protein
VATTLAGPQWLSGVLTAGIIAVLPFWLLFQRKNNQKGSGQISGKEEKRND